MDIEAIYNEHKTNPVWRQFTDDDIQDTLVKIYEKEPDIELDTDQTLKYFYIFCRNIKSNTRRVEGNYARILDEKYTEITTRMYNHDDIEKVKKDKQLYEIQLSQIQHHLVRKIGKVEASIFFAYMSPDNTLLDICEELGFSYSKGKKIIKSCKIELSNFLKIEVDEIIPTFKVGNLIEV